MAEIGAVSSKSVSVVSTNPVGLALELPAVSCDLALSTVAETIRSQAFYLATQSSKGAVADCFNFKILVLKRVKPKLHFF